MAIVFSVFLIIIGLAICFMGVCTHDLCKVLSSALRGFLWATIIRAMLLYIGILTGSANLFFGIIIFILAYLSWAHERIYHTIQGVLFGLVAGLLAASIIRGILFGIVYLSSFLYGGYKFPSPQLLGVASYIIIGLFGILGAFKHAFFRGFGSFLLIFLLCASILNIYLGITYAAISALICATICVLCARLLKEYVPILKIAAMGACLAVVGAWVLIGNHYLVSTLSMNVGDLLSSIEYSGRDFGHKMALPVVATALLAFTGTCTQVRLMKSLSEDGRFSLALLGDLWESAQSSPDTFFKRIIVRLHGVNETMQGFFAEKHPVLMRLLKGLCIAAMVAVIFLVDKTCRSYFFTIMFSR